MLIMTGALSAQAENETYQPDRDNKPAFYLIIRVNLDQLHAITSGKHASDRADLQIGVFAMNQERVTATVSSTLSSHPTTFSLTCHGRSAA
jgi:hypothetical protein